MDLIGGEGSNRHYFLHLSHGNLGSPAHGCIEVPGRLVEHQIAQGIRLLGLDESKIRKDGLLHHIVPSIELLHGLLFAGDLHFAIFGVFNGCSAFLDKSGVTSGRVEGGNAGSSSTNLLRKGSLRSQLHGQFSFQILTHQLSVFAHIGANHLGHLLLLDQDAQTGVVHTWKGLEF